MTLTDLIPSLRTSIPAQRPTVIAVHGGASRMLVRRETEVDLLSRDVGPVPERN